MMIVLFSCARITNDLHSIVVGVKGRVVDSEREFQIAKVSLLFLRFFCFSQEEMMISRDVETIFNFFAQNWSDCCVISLENFSIDDTLSCRGVN